MFTVAILAQLRDSMPPKKKPNQDVTVFHDVDGQVFYIRGGVLDPMYAFVMPESHVDIAVVNDAAFIRLEKKSKVFRGIAGPVLSQNEWVDHMVELRNAVCESEISNVRQAAGYSSWEASQAKLRSKQYKSKHDAVADIHTPRTVKIEFPAEDSHHAMCMDVPFELNAQASVFVPLRGDVLNWICAQMRASANNSTKGAKRKIEDAPEFKYPEVHWHARRNCGYADWLDADQRKHRHEQGLKEWLVKANQNREEAIALMGESIHEFYSNNHVPRTNAESDADGPALGDEDAECALESHDE